MLGLTLIIDTSILGISHRNGFIEPVDPALAAESLFYFNESPTCYFDKLHDLCVTISESL